MTDKARNVLEIIKKYKIFYDFSAKDISEASAERIYPATLTSMVKNGLLIKVGSNPSLYRYAGKECDEKIENSNYIWELFAEENHKIVPSKDFDIPIEISNGVMKFKTKQQITVGTKIDFFDSKVDEEYRYQAWNIMNYREDLKFIIFTFNKNYDKMLPENWNNGYKNVEIKVLKTQEDIKVCSQKEYLAMNNIEKNMLWNYCISLLEKWNGNDIVLNHSESFLVGYLYLFLSLTKLNKDTNEIEKALLKRYSQEDVDRFIILGKDISKRGIPIYKELE